MSYIICEGGNNYKSSNNLQGLFEELVVQPFNTFNNDPPTSAWEKHVKNKDNFYHMQTILKQGSANFSEGFEGLSPDDKVLLYCLYYMPMHLYGSYHVFRKYLTPKSDPESKEIVFIDFGCGPLTSGIAFWAAFSGLRDISYVGIDKAGPMLEKAKQINQYGSFFTNPNLLERWDQIDTALSQLIRNGDGTPIIFNFCYSLAPRTLDAKHLSIQDLSDTLNRIKRKYNGHNILVIYQNPQKSEIHENWHFLGTSLPAFQRCMTHSKTELFRYDKLTDGLGYTLKLYFDALFYKPFEPPRITPYSARSSHGESIDDTTIIEF